MRLRLVLVCLFFALAWFASGQNFHFSFAPINFILEQFFDAETLFTMPANLQQLLMVAIPVPNWLIWSFAFFASCFVFTKKRD